MGYKPSKNRQTNYVSDRQTMRRQAARERDQLLLQRSGAQSASTIIAQSGQPKLVRRMNRGGTR
jgi:hypothetical protein